MAHIGKQAGTVAVFAFAAMLGACQTTEEDAWPGVSSGTVSSAAPDFTAPVAGGQFGQRTPADVLQNQYGYAGEDLAGNRPVFPGTETDMNSYDSSKAQTAGSQAASKQGSAADLSPDPMNLAVAAGTSVDPTYDQEDPVEDWMAPEGSKLSTLLTEWGNKSGWRVIWQTNREYTLQAGAMFRGRFMDVASAILRSFARAAPAPWGTFYKGNRVLLITTQEDENADD